MKFLSAFIVMGALCAEVQGVELERRANGLWYSPGVRTPYTGKAERTHFDGTRVSEVSYLKGRQHGLSRFWYNNGNIRSTFSYDAGVLDGNSTYYYRNGNIQNLTSYRKGVKHGLVIDWWPEGKKSFVESYVNGFPEGVWRSWWPNGKQASERAYRNRRLVAHKEWNKDGLPKTVPGWNLDGTFKSATSLRERQRVFGRRVLWDRNSGTNRIDLIYRDKPLSTIRIVFGDPDETDDTRWTYKGLRIQDPVNGTRFDTAIFRFKRGKVSEIWIE